MNKNELIRIHDKKERFCLSPLKEFYVLEARGARNYEGKFELFLKPTLKLKLGH